VWIGHGTRKGVEIHDEQIDGDDLMLGHCGIIDPAPTQQPTMNLRMQRLQAPVHHLRKAGVVGDITHRQPRIAQQAGGASGGQDFDAALPERTGQIRGTALVGH
jgi:hypothetical protein